MEIYGPPPSFVLSFNTFLMCSDWLECLVE